MAQVAWVMTLSLSLLDWCRTWPWWWGGRPSSPAPSPSSGTSRWGGSRRTRPSWPSTRGWSHTTTGSISHTICTTHGTSISSKKVPFYILSSKYFSILSVSCFCLIMFLWNMKYALYIFYVFQPPIQNVLVIILIFWATRGFQFNSKLRCGSWKAELCQPIHLLYFNVYRWFWKNWVQEKPFLVGLNQTKFTAICVRGCVCAVYLGLNCRIIWPISTAADIL